MSTLDVIEVWWHSIRQARSGTHYIPTGMLVCRSNVPIRSIALDHVTYPGSYRVSYELAWLSAATYHSFCRYHLHASFVVGTTFQQVASSGNNGANSSKSQDGHRGGDSQCYRSIFRQTLDAPTVIPAGAKLRICGIMLLNWLVVCDGLLSYKSKPHQASQLRSPPTLELPFACAKPSDLSFI